ncbi:MAG: hypothetical protein INQ03_11820 [Candidatus Heimdallarchaeota archaeon]|nr:hypothetical protein [Candidatus Heimdallarchaeota archaeon]
MDIPPLHIRVDWDYDSLEQSLRRGYFYDYNLYMIYLDRKNEYWRDLDPLGSTELYYIGSTRMMKVSDRLLSNHDAIQTAVQDFGDIFIALGQVDIDTSSMSIQSTNELVKIIEAGLIYHIKPRFNKLNRMNFDGIPLTIDNRLRSYGGINVAQYILEKELKTIDSLGFSSFVNKYHEEHSSIIDFLGRLELDLPYLNDTITIN